MQISSVLAFLAMGGLSMAVMDCGGPKGLAAPDCAAQCYSAGLFKHLYGDVRRTGIILKADHTKSAAKGTKTKRKASNHAFVSKHGLMTKHISEKHGSEISYYRDGSAEAAFKGLNNAEFQDSRAWSGAAARDKVLKKMKELKMTYTPEQAHKYDLKKGAIIITDAGKFGKGNHIQTIEEQPPASSSQGSIWAVIAVADGEAQQRQSGHIRPNDDGNYYIVMSNWAGIEACDELAAMEGKSNAEAVKIIKAHKDFGMMHPTTGELKFAWEWSKAEVNKYFEEANWKQGEVSFIAKKEKSLKELNEAQVKGLPKIEKERLGHVAKSVATKTKADQSKPQGKTPKGTKPNPPKKGKKGDDKDGNKRGRPERTESDNSVTAGKSSSKKHHGGS